MELRRLSEIVSISFRKRPFLYFAFILITFISFRNFFAPADNKPPDIYLQKIKKPNSYRGEIINWPQVSRNKTSFIMRLDDKTKVYCIVRAEETSLTKGQTIEAKGTLNFPKAAKNPGVFDFKKYLSVKKVFLILSVEAGDIKIVKQPNIFGKFIAGTRRRILSSVRRHLDGESAGILSQMLIGQRDDTTKELRPFFIDAGVMHILVISGLHVGYIALIFWYLFRIFGFSRKHSALLMLPFLWCYVIITGSNPPVVRSAVMSTVVIFYLLLGRSYDLFQALGLSAVIILAMNPSDIFNASFQLSYAATFGIMYLTPKIQSPFLKLHSFFRKLGQMFCVSTSAQIFSAPLIAYYFHKLSLISLLSNLFVVPWMGLIIGGGIFLCVADQIFPPIAAGAGFLISLAIHALIKVIKFFSGLPGAGMWAAQPSALFFVGYYFLAIVLPRFSYGKFWRVVSVAAVLLFIVVGMIQLKHDRKELKITFLSTEGDAILLDFPNDRKYLIDAGGSFTGNDVGGKVLLPFLKYKNIPRLDKVFITTPDIPHYMGLTAILDSVRIDGVYVNPVISDYPEYIELMNALESKNIPVKEIWAPYEFSEDKVRISVLNPERRSAVWEENPLVIMVEYRQKKILLTSDINRAIEKKLAKSVSKVDILQVPRHGKDASAEFIKKLSPDYVVISGGGKSRVQLLTTAKIFDTFSNGAITISISDKIRATTMMK